MWWSTRIERKLDWIIQHRIKREEKFDMAWADIKNDVRQVGDVGQALVRVLGDVRAQLKASLDAAKGGEFVPTAEIEAIHAELDKYEGEMVKAVTEGTPAENPNGDHETGM
jgi:hypothetical protein